MPERRGNSLKAAFQLSLGFIVAVVFAVILLSLSLTWLQGMFNPLSTITHKTTDIAMQRLLQELASSDKKVGIAAPAVTKWKKGETGSYALGIKNNDANNDKTFYINVYLEEVGGGLSNPESLKDDVGDWLTFPRTKDLEAGERNTVDIIIKPPTSVKEGIYLFRAAVCDRKDLDCHATSPSVGYETPSSSLYGSASFAIEITG